jgi:hypothetical protein
MLFRSFLLFIFLCSCAYGRETITYETILSASLGKWDRIVFREYFDAAGKVTAYTFERLTEYRDRRIPAILEDSHCFLSADTGDESNVEKVTEGKDAFFISLRFDALNDSSSSLVLDAKVSGEDTTVHFSGSGPIYREFQEYLDQCKKAAAAEDCLDEKGNLIWKYKEEN